MVEAGGVAGSHCLRTGSDRVPQTIGCVTQPPTKSLSRGNDVGSDAPHLGSQPPSANRPSAGELALQAAEFAFSFRARSPIPVRCLDDPLTAVHLRLHLSFGGLAFALGVRDKSSKLGELTLKAGDLSSHIANLRIGQQTRSFQLRQRDPPLGSPYDGLDRTAVGSGAHCGQRDPTQLSGFTKGIGLHRRLGLLTSKWLCVGCRTPYCVCRSRPHTQNRCG